MKVSIKELLSKIDPQKTSGIFTFEKPPQIRILNRDGTEAESYDALKELPLSDDERRFVDKNWQEILQKNPQFYDGYVTAVIDIIYNVGANSLEFIMDKTRYSTSCAIYKDGYPNPQRAKEFLSFGIGLMANIKLAQDDSLLMMQRSQNVHSEKGAYSVPGGALEFKKNSKGEVEKDGVAAGLKSSVLQEVEEEVLPEPYLRDKKFLGPKDEFEEFFETSLNSIDWSKNPTNGKTGINCTFQVTTAKPLTRGDITQAFEQAEDKGESSGNFRFVQPQAGVDERGDSYLYATPLDMIESGGLQNSGINAISNAIYDLMQEVYAKGLCPGAAPRMEAVAQRIGSDRFSIFELSKILQNWVERPLSIVQSQEAKALAQEKSQEKIRANPQN